MSMATKPMKERILEHLQKYGTITSWEAIMDYGCTRISQYILLLRKENYPIVSVRKNVKTRYGYNTSIAEYTLEREN